MEIQDDEENNSMIMRDNDMDGISPKNQIKSFMNKSINESREQNQGNNGTKQTMRQNQIYKFFSKRHSNRMFYKTPRKHLERSKSPFNLPPLGSQDEEENAIQLETSLDYKKKSISKLIFTPLTQAQIINLQQSKDQEFNKNGQVNPLNISTNSIEKFIPQQQNMSKSMHMKSRSQTNHHYKRIKKLSQGGFPYKDFNQQNAKNYLMSQQNQRSVDSNNPQFIFKNDESQLDFSQETAPNILTQNLNNKSSPSQRQHQSKSQAKSIANIQTAQNFNTSNQMMITDFRSTKDTNFFKDSSQKPFSSQSTTIYNYRGGSTQTGKRSALINANNQITQMAKQEILELSIIKRQLIDEISILKLVQEKSHGKSTNLKDNEKISIFNEQNSQNDIPFYESKLSARDFEDLTKEELMEMLAKSREEIIYLRAQNNRYKSKVIELKQQRKQELNLIQSYSQRIEEQIKNQILQQKLGAYYNEIQRLEAKYNSEVSILQQCNEDLTTQLIRASAKLQDQKYSRTTLMLLSQQDDSKINDVLENSDKLQDTDILRFLNDMKTQAISLSNSKKNLIQEINQSRTSSQKNPSQKHRSLSRANSKQKMISDSNNKKSLNSVALATPTKLSKFNKQLTTKNLMGQQMKKSIKL
eukprot:403367428